MPPSATMLGQSESAGARAAIATQLHAVRSGDKNGRGDGRRSAAAKSASSRARRRSSVAFAPIGAAAPAELDALTAPDTGRWPWPPVRRVRWN